MPYRFILCLNIAFLCLILVLKALFPPLPPGTPGGAASRAVRSPSSPTSSGSPGGGDAPAAAQPQHALAQCMGPFPSFKRFLRLSVYVSRAGLVRAHQNLAGVCTRLVQELAPSNQSLAARRPAGPGGDAGYAWTYRRFCFCMLSLTSHPDMCLPPPLHSNIEPELGIPADAPITRLMIVAHADDESIFGAIPLIIHKGWLVVCVTCDHPRRAVEFVAVVRTAGAIPAVLNIATTNHLDRRQLASHVDCLLRSHKFSMIVTHNPEGDYGHVHHKEIFQTVSGLLSLGDPDTRNSLYVFHKSQSFIPEASLKTLFQMLIQHRSQYESIIFWHPFVLHQSIVHCPLLPCQKFPCPPVRECAASAFANTTAVATRAIEEPVPAE